MRHSPAEDGTARSLEQLAHLSRAEDFFRFFGLEYDPKVLTGPWTVPKQTLVLAPFDQIMPLNCAEL